MKFSGMICHHPRTNWLDFGSDQVKGQGHEKILIFVIMRSVFVRFIWNQRQNVHFSIPYALICQRSRSRSWKGQKHILVIARSVFFRFIWNECQKVHFSIPYPLIGQRSRSQKGQKHILVITRSVLVRFIWNQCQNVHFSILYPLIGQRSRSQKGQKHILVITRSVFIRFIRNGRQKVLFNSLSSDRSKVKVMKRSNTYFGHNSQFLSDSYETNAKMFTFQFPILW